MIQADEDKGSSYGTGVGMQRKETSQEVFWYSDKLDSKDEAKGKFKDDFKVDSLGGKKKVAASSSTKW